MKAYIKRSVLETIGIFIFLWFSFFLIQISDMSIIQKCYICSWVALIELILLNVVFYREHKTLFSGIMAFMWSFFAFCLGLPLLKALGLLPDGTYYDVYMGEHLLFAIKYSCYCVFLFFLGCLLVKRDNEKNKSEAAESNVLLKKSCMIIGVSLIVISIYFQISDLYNIFTVSMTHGYRGLFEIDSPTGIMGWRSILAKFFIPGLFLVYYSSKHKIIRWPVTLFVIAYISIYILSGDRSTPLPLLIAWLFFIKGIREIEGRKQFSFKGIIIVFLIIFTMFPAFTAVRNSADRNINDFITIYTTSFKEGNPAIGAFVEMGSSIFPLIMTHRLIPEYEPYHYGITYLAAFSAIIPNFATDGSAHIASEICNIPRWLHDTLNLNYGPGGSLPTEAFYNFGNWGMICMIPLGLLIGKIIGINNMRPEVSKKIFFAFMISVLSMPYIMDLPRRELYDMIRGVSYYSILPVFCVWLLEKYSKS